MITREEAEQLLENQNLIFVTDTIYTTSWFSKDYLVTKDKCDGHLAILIRRSDKGILYACEHTKQGAQMLGLSVK